MLLGSHQKLARNSIVDIALNGRQTIMSENHKYLDATLDRNINLQIYINNMHRKGAFRIKLLWRIRIYINPVVAETI